MMEMLKVGNSYLLIRDPKETAVNAGKLRTIRMMRMKRMDRVRLKRMMRRWS